MVVIQEKHTPLEALGCRGHSVPLASEGPHIRLPGHQKMCRSSGPASLYLPLLVWQSSPPSSGVYPTGGPAIPATAHSFFMDGSGEETPPVPGTPGSWGCLQEAC